MSSVPASSNGGPARRRPRKPSLLTNIGQGPDGRLTTRQKVAPALGLVVFLLCVGYTLLPFDVVDAVDCGPALFGSKPEEAPVAVIVDEPKRACRDAGNSRLAFAAVVGTAAAVIGVAGLVLPSDPEET
ncbi:MAG TPA: hypothetical protein VHE80_05720 [Acidimicrobiales bacterium]|nr:hypothetical protein [Acidimicrobiales bacterium]